MTVTGYLYAGVGAKVLNAGGTRRLLRRFGLAVSAVPPRRRFIVGNHLLQAGVGGRWRPPSFDLGARWSVSNTFKSVVWIAVDVLRRARLDRTSSRSEEATAAVVAGYSASCPSP